MTGRAGKGFRFCRVSLASWRNFAKVEVALQRRMFLIGPNASGKSNLLDVFRFLHDIVSVGGVFQEAVRRRGGASRIRCLAAKPSSDIELRVQIGNDGAPSDWEYALSFTHDRHDQPIIRRERVLRRGTPLLDRPDKKDLRDPERLTQTFLEQVNANQDFRAVAEFFETVRYLYVVPHLLRESDRLAGRQSDIIGGDFLQQVARTPEKTRKIRLRRIEGALRVAVPQLTELRVERDKKGTPHLMGRAEHWRAKGATQDEKQLSDGTLRLVGLLWATLDGTGPLLLEEPELSLHPDVVRAIPQMFARAQRRSGRQILVSTHSTDLLQDEGIAPDEVLLLETGKGGTTVRPASGLRDINSLLASGMNLAEAVLPYTRPRESQQLMLFGD